MLEVAMEDENGTWEALDAMENEKGTCEAVAKMPIANMRASPCPKK